MDGELEELNNENFNNEDLIKKYEASLNMAKVDDIAVDWEIYDKNYNSLLSSKDVLVKSFAKIYRFFNITAQPYVKFILFFREGNWYKYNSNNPYPIQLNLAIMLTNNELFKLVKRKLYDLEKSDLLNFFLELKVNSNCLWRLEILQNHLIIFKNLKIDSPIYLKLKILLEYLFSNYVYSNPKHFAT